MTNEGTTAISIRAFTFPGPSEANNCGTQLGAGAGCTINVTLSSPSKGNLTDTLSITDNGGGSPQTVA